MVVITCNLAADNGPKQYLEDVSAAWWDLQKEDRDTDVILVSGEHQARAHRAILFSISPFLHGLVPPSCPCSTPVISLPKVQGDTLEALVELAYTGRSKVESKKDKEEFVELTKALEIGLEVQYEEIVNQEREDPVTRANQVAEGETAIKRNEEKAAADKRKKDEEKAAADKRKKDEEKAAENERKKDEEKSATADKGKEELTSTADKKKKTAATKIKIDEGKDAEKKKNNKTAAPKQIENRVLEEMPIEEINVLEKMEVKLTPDSVETSKLVDKAPSVQVGGSRRTRGRKSKVQETRTIPFLSQIGRNRRTKSPDSILAKTTRNQKRKIQTILDVNDEIDATPETKKKRFDVCIDKTEELSKFVNIQDIIANNSTDTNLFEENDINGNNNDVKQDPIKVNAASQELFENSHMSILSDEGFLDGSKDGWDKETERYVEEAKFVCPFCEKKFQKKVRYDNHISWNHFQEEISEKFPGLECPVCMKRFVKKSSYVSHLGAFHKIIDGLMAVAFEDKMALIRGAETRKSFASPKHEGGDCVWMETPKRKNASISNKKNSSCKETEESREMANAATEEGSEMANAATEESSQMANTATEDISVMANSATVDSSEMPNAAREESSEMPNAVLVESSEMPGKDLLLQSPAMSEAWLYKWPLAKGDPDEDEEEYVIDEAKEIVDTIKWVGRDHEEIEKAMGGLLENYDTESYNSMKTIVNTYNKAVNNMLKNAKTRKNAMQRLNKRPSKAMLKHILKQVYRLAILDPNELNHYEPHSPEVYGEASYELVNKMISELAPISAANKFLDLGSGVGQVVLQMAALTECQLCVGIEKADIPARRAEDMDKMFRRWMDWYGKKYSDFKIYKGDFLDDKFKPVLTDSTILFVNNFAFGPEVDHMLKEKFTDLQEGTRIVSSKAFCPLNFRLTFRNLGDIGAIMHVSHPNHLTGSVSWTGKEISYYLHVKDSTKMERFFTRQNNRPRGRSSKSSSRNASKNNSGSNSRASSEECESMEVNVNGVTEERSETEVDEENGRRPTDQYEDDPRPGFEDFNMFRSMMRQKEAPYVPSVHPRAGFEDFNEYRTKKRQRELEKELREMEVQERERENPTETDEQLPETPPTPPAPPPSPLRQPLALRSGHQRLEVPQARRRGRGRGRNLGGASAETQAEQKQ